MDKSSNPFVSVIIPVFNDADRLKLCLESLENQSYPEHFYEVIVVDNASDKTQKISTVVMPYLHAIYAYESQPGSYAARNKGISLAKGEIIAFTDADCIPSADWLEKGVSHLLKNPNCGLVAGKIEIFFQNPEQLNTVEIYESIMALPQQEFFEKHQYGATANVLTRKTVIEDVGTFDQALKSSGDLEWGKRVYTHGYQQIYAEDVCIAHPAKRSFRQLYKRTIRHAGGIYDLYNNKNNSFFNRNLWFLRYLSFNLMPPLMFAVQTFNNLQLKTISHKIQVVLMLVFVRYVTAWELARLKLGGISARE